MLEVLERVKKAQSDLYAQAGLKIDHFLPEEESAEYYAHTFTLNNKRVLFRIAKKTPTKTGWFVTIWKRGADNIIAPYDRRDAIDFVVIAVSDNNNVGEFIFPQTILLEKKILSDNAQEGKRAIRVYTPWDITISPQAVKTQQWQSQFFVDLGASHAESTLTIKNVYSM